MANDDGEPFDLVVVGGGAAGFYGALMCAEAADRRLRIVILERSRRVLQKVKISGGGRCNVTHDTHDPRWLSTNYPRGEKPLLGPLHRHRPHDVVGWFEGRGVKLKTEADGRMFPTSDDSQTVIDCFRGAARDHGIGIRTRTEVTAVTQASAGFELRVESSGRDGNAAQTLRARSVLLATGGIRTGCGAGLARSLGHTIEPAVPSLFTFQIDSPVLRDLQGVSVDHVRVRVPEAGLDARGPVVITHWGLSGPAVLKLSAWGARALHELDYQFELRVDWLDGVGAEETLKRLPSDPEWGKRQISSRSPFPELPKRLWQRLAESARIPETRTWAECTVEQRTSLVGMLDETRLRVRGQSVNKDEFVTCGGVPTDEVDMRTMESRLTPGLFFAGELLDIDGITGGFNFQSAWTTGWIAGTSIASRSARE